MNKTIDYLVEEASESGYTACVLSASGRSFSGKGMNQFGSNKG